MSEHQNTHASRGVVKVLEAYCQSFPDQMARLLDLVNCRNFTSADLRSIARSAHAEAHRMAGAAQCMGFREVGRELGRIEARLEKTISQKRRDANEDLDVVVEKIAVISTMMDQIRPENSRLISRDLLGTQASAEEDLRLADHTDLTSQRILFADDDPFVRSILQTTLESLGVDELKSVASGLEVLNAIRDFKPDIIITDWHMQPISGLELLQHIRSGTTPLASDTPIIFFTSQRDRESRMQALVHGANRILTKPVSPDVLSKTISEVVAAQAFVILADSGVSA